MGIYKALDKMLVLGIQHRSGHDDSPQSAPVGIYPAMGRDTQRLLACTLDRVCDQRYHEPYRMVAYAGRCGVHTFWSGAILHRSMQGLVDQLEVAPCG